MASSDIPAGAVIIALLALIIWIFIRITIRARRRGGSLTTLVLGSTDEFLTQEKSKAAETIVDENAGKKFNAAGIPEHDPAPPGPLP